MEMRKYLGLMAAVVLLALTVGSGARVEDKVCKPFTYSGYSSAVYTGIEKKSAYVPMSDGVKLAIDIYLPTGGPAGPTPALPVIIEYTPYTRAFIDVNNSAAHKALRKKMLGSEANVIDLLHMPGDMGDAIRNVIAHGYVFVRADMRGCGASTGWKIDFMPQIGKDGGEMVDWIARQPWCDGNIGMIGGSYAGYSQIVTAGHAGPALKAIAPTVVPVDGYDGEVYPGGAYLQKFMEDYSANLQRLNLNYYTLTLKNIIAERYDLPGGQRVMMPAAPVIDEDGDGDLADEVPLDLNRNGTFLDDYQYPDNPDDPPRYGDGKSRQHIYYLAIRDHRANGDYYFFSKTLFYIDEIFPKPFEQYSSYDFSPSSQIPAIIKKGIAIYNLGGWFDAFARGTTEYFATLRKTNPSRLLMGAGYHGGGGPYWAYAGEKNFSMIKLYQPELLRFFDRYLKGIDNGIDREDPVLIYVVHGGGWRTEKEWPLARQKEMDLFFADGHGLSAAAGAAGSDHYRADFSHDSRYGKSLGNRFLAAMGVDPDVLPVRTAKDRQCLTYTAAPFAADTEVTGHPILDFWVSNIADHADFYIYLEDVDEKGEAVLVSEGVLRANYHELRNNDEMIMGGGSGIDVLPDLPWHGFKKADYDDGVFRGGKVVPFTIDFKPVAWVFRAGHAVRVTIALADWPTFRLHPRLSPENDPRDPANIIPVITVYRGADRPSRVRLPVIPK